MKEPGFSRERARPFKVGPLTKVASVMDALSFTSPALTVKVAAAVLFFSDSYLPFSEAFIISST